MSGMGESISGTGTGASLSITLIFTKERSASASTLLARVALVLLWIFVFPPFNIFSTYGLNAFIGGETITWLAVGSRAYYTHIDQKLEPTTKLRRLQGIGLVACP